MVSTPIREEKEWRSNDPEGVGANSPSQDQPVASTPMTPVEQDIEKEDLSDSKKNGTAPTRTPSALSTTSMEEKADSEPNAKPAKRSWNPLKRNPQPIPTERSISREYTAGFFSRLTWQWITPVMTVSTRDPESLHVWED